jgi:hypothetical protein
MNKRRTIAVLAIVNLGADVLAIWYGAGKNFPHPALIVGYALLFAQVSLGAIWLGLGGTAIGLRLVAYCGLLAAVYAGLSALHDNHGQWLRLLAVQTLAICGPLTVARRRNLRLQATEATPNEQPFQFTLKHVFALMTACAVLFGALRLAPPWPTLGNRASEVWLGVGFALMALVAAWVSLGYGRWLLKLLALPLVTFLVGGLLTAIEGPAGRLVQAGIMSLVFCQMLFLAAPLVVLRRCGYRLMRQATH